MQHANSCTPNLAATSRACSRAAFAALTIAASFLQPSQAAVHIVNVGGGMQVFSPAALTIAVNDTVTFINKGGNHNVVANDGSFHCARGCTGDGHGGDGSSSSTIWVASLTFTQAGVVGYFCETHGSPGMGMFGTITVGTSPVQLQSFDVE